MNSKQKNIVLLGFLVLLLIILNYPLLDESLSEFLDVREKVHVERVIDGDTIVGENLSNSIRLLGINTPERGELYSEEATEFLQLRVLNETVELEFGKEKTDLYGRFLAYVYINRTNVNLQLVENGFANYYFPSGKDQKYNDFKEAWESCIERNTRLCEASTHVCSQCIQLEEFDYKNDRIVFHNTCNNVCELTNWEIKDEGRKKFVFPEFVLHPNNEVTIEVRSETDNSNVLFWRGETYVFTETGDTLFLRDDAGKLVLWEGY